MKQKTIIQLWGTAEQGKTETIKIVREELIRMCNNPNHTYSLPLPKGEINDVIICNNITIGIESMGDYLWYGNLHDRLNDYVFKHNCDIIICASRVRNDVAKHIEHLADANNYRLIKVTNYRADNPPFDHHILNQQSAIHITDLVNQIIIGTI